jgi:inositol oxygenase
MAPSAIYPEPRDGAKLDTISDAIDDVNILKKKMSEKSTFDADKDKTTFRQYEDDTTPEHVKQEYATQHAKQTVAFNLRARNNFHHNKQNRPVMTVWEAMEKLDKLIDPSDPDTSVGQIMHLLQTAEAMRRDGKPDWMQLTGLIHDLGKLLFFYGSEGTWDVVGDTFPVGCRFDESNILHHTFAANPDSQDPIYSTENGIYTPGCGIENLMISWGHDEYLYLVMKNQSSIPREGLAMIRFHSFYPWHSKGGYMQFMKEGDEDLLAAVRAFNPYDLYSKSDEVPPSVEDLKVCLVLF